MLIKCLFSMSTGTMSSFLNGFDKTDAMFLKFTEDLNNPMEGSSSVGDNSGESNGTSTDNYLNLFLTLTCCVNLFSRYYLTISDSDS